MSKVEERYWFRVSRWRKSGVSFPEARHRFWWLLHNLVAHVLLGVLPCSATVWFHDWTSKELNRKMFMTVSTPPKIPSRCLWALHNILAHAAIGLFPCKTTFEWHDKTAIAMNVPDWV